MDTEATDVWAKLSGYEQQAYRDLVNGVARTWHGTRNHRCLRRFTELGCMERGLYFTDLGRRVATIAGG